MQTAVFTDTGKMKSTSVPFFQNPMQTSRKQDTGFVPVLFPLMKNRRTLFIIIFLAGLQIVTTVFGFGIWKCPVYTTLGIQCPGCGISTAMSLLVQGNWEEALHAHLFAPFLLAGFFLIAAFAFLPEKIYRKLLCRIYLLERKIGFVQWLFVSMFLYWIVRISGMI